jgi:hypothetical protein
MLTKGIAERDMKVYIVGFQQREEDPPPTEPGKPWGNVDVFFSSKRGDWLMEDLEYAQRELNLLRSLRVRVGDHFCQLALEEEKKTFAIVCVDHPAEVRG